MAASASPEVEWMMDLYDCISQLEVIQGGKTRLRPGEEV